MAKIIVTRWQRISFSIELDSGKEYSGQVQFRFYKSNPDDSEFSKLVITEIDVYDDPTNEEYHEIYDLLELWGKWLPRGFQVLQRVDGSVYGLGEAIPSYKEYF